MPLVSSKFNFRIKCPFQSTSPLFYNVYIRESTEFTCLLISRMGLHFAASVFFFQFDALFIYTVYSLIEMILFEVQTRLRYEKGHKMKGSGWIHSNEKGLHRYSTRKRLLQSNQFLAKIFYSQFHLIQRPASKFFLQLIENSKIYFKYNSFNFVF